MHCFICIWISAPLPHILSVHRAFIKLIVRNLDVWIKWQNYLEWFQGSRRSFPNWCWSPLALPPEALVIPLTAKFFFYSWSPPFIFSAPSLSPLPSYTCVIGFFGYIQIVLYVCISSPLYYSVSVKRASNYIYIFFREGKKVHKNVPPKG